jgi:hypothetical protein
VSVIWTGQDGVKRRMTEYAMKVRLTAFLLAQYWAAILENDAKTNAQWQDQTGNARQTLHAFAVMLSADMIALYLSHGVNYGVFLEVRYAGRYAIIWPTIEQHLPMMRQMLQEIFK